MVVYTKSSFSNNSDSSTQLVYLFNLTYRYNRTNIVHFDSYKSKRIVRSVLGVKTYAFAHGLHAAFMVSHDMERMVW